MALKDTLATTFNPLFIVGIPTLFKVLQPFSSAPEVRFDTLLKPDVHIPILLVAFTLASSTLAHTTNRQFVDSCVHAQNNSIVGMLTFATVGCILLMYLFSTNIATTRRWLGSYALLCLFNAAWNYFAVDRATRRPHVLFNLVTGVLLLTLVSVPVIAPRQLWTYYLIFAGLGVAKTIQRGCPRTFICDSAT
ncbi:MAG TPA: hypothetical protein VEK79_19490 [Thermoanaerobaculia bacterium]|nr:hypothetical protein [Thermoanaerobaculia bacterium]